MSISFLNAVSDLKDICDNLGVKVMESDLRKNLAEILDNHNPEDKRQAFYFAFRRSHRPNEGASYADFVKAFDEYQASEEEDYENDSRLSKKMDLLTQKGEKKMEPKNKIIRPIAGTWRDDISISTRDGATYNVTRRDVYDVLKVSFQDGTVRDAGVNGVQVDHLLAICHDRLWVLAREAEEKGMKSCHATAAAADHIKRACAELFSRTEDRVKRGVEGTYES